MSEIQFYKQLDGVKLFFIEECTSTQDLILQLLANKSARNLGLNQHEGLAIFTHFQTHGRGQENRIWQSRTGENLICSLAFELTESDLVDLVAINKSITLAILDQLQQAVGTDQDLKIKWPNDLFYQDKKLGGLLMQVVQEQGIRYLVVGVGINVNQANWDESIQQKATSLKMILGKEWDVFTLLENLLHALSPRKKTLKLGDIDSNFNKHLWGLNWQVNLEINEQWKDKLKLRLNADAGITATLLGVDHVGRLMVLDTDGNHLVFNHGEARIKLLK